MGNFVLIISSPSGGGKTTIINELLKARTDVKRVVTATTRSPREGERNGRDYLFWSVKKFEAAVKAGKMAEWAKVHTDYYGIPKESLDGLLRRGLIPALIIDVQGADTVRKHYKNTVSVFIMPPSWAELKRRLLARPGGTNNINLRLKTARAEAARAEKYDYVIINDELKKAVSGLDAVISARSAEKNNRRIK